MNRFALLVSFFVSAVSLAQNVRVEGIVTDKDQHPLEMANVMAVDQTTKAMAAYAITNDKGRYVLNLPANKAYTIKLSFLGMKNLEILIKTETGNLKKDLVMEEGGIDLEGVEIVREMPVSISGDTISYNADSFKTGTERKLEDVLKKLPGIEVDADGAVKVEGKTVSKLMVEGKDFFDGDTKLGVKNIPADAIDKVQVLRNYNEISQMKGLENNEESVAMNIKLKDGKKNFWFGDLTAGIGVGHQEDRYIVNPKVFYYNPKYSVNLIANFNNIGELPLTIQDYMKMSGGFRSMMGRGGSNFNVSSNDLGISLLRNNRAKDIETRFGAANFSYNPTKSWTLSGFGIINSSTTQLETQSKSTVVDTGDGQTSDETALQQNRLGLLKLSSSYKPSASFQLDYDLIAKRSQQQEATGIFRQTITDGVTTPETIYTDKTQNPTSVNQNLNIYWTRNDKNIFSFGVQHLYQDEDPFYNANLIAVPFFLPGLDVAQSRANISQERLVRTSKLDVKLDYFYVLTPKSNLNVTLGNTYSHQNFNSQLFQLLDNDTRNDLDQAATNNDVTYDFNDVSLGLHYKLLTGKFTFNPGFTVHYYDMNNAQLGTEAQQRFTKVLPDFYALWQIKKSQTLTYEFKLTNDFTDINQLAEGTIFSSYTSLFRGNRYLENATSQSHSLRYFKFNMFNQENIFAFLNYSKKENAIKTNADFTGGINQASMPYNSNFADESFSGSGHYGRSFLRYYKASLRASASWSKFYNRRNGLDVSTESFTHSYTFSASTNYKKIPNLEVGYNLTLNDYTGSTFYNERPFLRLDYYFLNAFSFVSEYEFNHYYNSERTSDNEYDFLSASMAYQKKGGKWEYKVAATNLLNTRSLNDDSFSQFITRTSQYTVQPRYIVLSLKYNL